MFKKLDPKRKYSEMEQDVLSYWKENETFEKSIENRDKSNAYVFYDGPPFITGVPHYGTLLSSIVKDVVPRYWTMKGKRVERRWGWDCHGLPAENLVEKKLGIKDKRDVPKVGLEKYIKTCHLEMVQGGSVWEDTIERIGRWVEFKNAYKTMDKEYMESVWWAFKTLHEKGKIYEGEKVLMYCTRCATPISKSEVAMDNSYKVVTDPSSYVKFELEGEKNTFLLAWTTTPWTLSANVALAVGKDIKYVKIAITDIETGDVEYYIAAKDIYEKENSLIKASLVDRFSKSEDTVPPIVPEVVEEIKGSDLVGKKYKPLFEDHGENAHRIIAGDFVTTEDGTGIVHIAPAFGEDDYVIAKKENLPIVNTVDENGNYIDGRWAGKNVWEINKEIAKTLLAEEVVMKIDYIQHEYPHCHRCDTKLMYRAHPSWFMDIEGQKQKMLEQNENINWFPATFKEKRFKNTVETAPDWNLSRDRFWATPIPVWRGEKEDGTVIEKVIGSYAELKELSGQELDDYHLPYVDKITFEYKGVQMKRVEKVMDCWFESGSMPFAQFHYPFENKEKFEENFPGDFISEYVGQVRAWFYYLHAISVGLFGEEAFKNVIVTGTIAGSDGKKMSKSLGNYTDSNILLDQYSADALRYLLMSSPLLNGEDFTLIDKDVSDIQRKLGTLWNSYSFFVMYANIDKWSSDDTKSATTGKNLLDKWILSELNKLIKTVDENMEEYNLPGATKTIMDFIDQLSNWYIRRSRRRFWKSESDSDKQEAYQTLWTVLVEFSKLIAPFTPFVADEIYRNLTDEESVHLADYPVAKEDLIEEEISKKMASTRKVIEFGLNLRAENKLKVRQPLSELLVFASKVELGEEYLELIKDEVNVRKVIQTTNEEKENEQLKQKEDNEIRVYLNLEITEELKLEGDMRELVRFIQSARKKAGFEIQDRIQVNYKGGEMIFNKFSEEISKEVLAESIENITLTEEFDYSQKISVNGTEVEIWLKKVQ
ncbi:isoleucine--tRNA ligase [bacterium]|nr:isoleucine--tRNA ligase [bacterium]MBT4251583.1 isoleucine--tRNA ligase [bacterium]MBT4597632.1 isoleucine--tRNA ligase [bacterium]MBT6753646.1 isoleucine--tRNA ligase [bacterium]MBT7037783.1 isoleucine--tRNA ligase [bacterium]